MEERKNALYVRVKRNATKNELSIKLEVLREFLLKNGIICDNEYSDKSSAFILNEQSRPGLFRLMTDVVLGKIDTVYAYSKDNISPIGAPLVIHICKMFKTKMVFVADQSQIASEKGEIYHELSIFSQKMLSNYGDKSKR